MNQEPGPTTTQSASAIATSASGQAGGSAGSSATSTTWPSVVATSAWPRISVITSGWSGSSPSTRAVMSSGTADIGSTRPCAPSNRATQSSPSTASPSSSHNATISRLPTA